MHTYMIHTVLFSFNNSPITLVPPITKVVRASISELLGLCLSIVRRHAGVFKIKQGLDCL